MSNTTSKELMIKCKNELKIAIWHHMQFLNFKIQIRNTLLEELSAMRTFLIVIKTIKLKRPGIRRRKGLNLEMPLSKIKSFIQIQTTNIINTFLKMIVISKKFVFIYNSIERSQRLISLVKIKRLKKNVLAVTKGNLQEKKKKEKTIKLMKNKWLER